MTDDNKKYIVEIDQMPKHYINCNCYGDQKGKTSKQASMLPFFNIKKILFFIYFKFLFCIGVQTINNVIVLGEMQRDSTIHIHVSILPQTPFHPACHITLSRVPCLYSRSLLVIHFKNSSVHMSIPNSLTIPCPKPQS